MKVSLISFLSFNFLFSQDSLINQNKLQFPCSKQIKDFNVRTIEKEVDEPAYFPYGNNELNKFIYTNISFLDSINNDNCTNKIILEFIILKDGSICNVNLKSNPNCKIENIFLLDSFNKMPKWKPAKKNGEVINSNFALPIYINID